ncbi:MAG TPA: ABC transporter ATP-binding protein [Thermoleophilia bacterium]|nr:ABC transporter ATP-binding protein [Thermoleophilia bacterium]
MTTASTPARELADIPTSPGVGAHCAPGEVITTAGLSKTFPGGIHAVVDLDLSVNAGEIFGLLGPNGAGKTTTVGMLSTRVVPTAGSACVGGVDVVAHAALAKQAIGVVAQSNTLDRSLTVWENLYYHCRYFGVGAREARARADELLDQFRLADRAKASVYALSGGMAQRLMVARSIAHRPHILFLDEPTAGLDPQSRLALWDILHELHGEGLTVLLTTHYMEEADRLCDRVAIMDHGRVLALDTPAGLKASVDADTIVSVSAEGDPEALAARLAAMPDAVRAEVVDKIATVFFRGTGGIVPRVVAEAEAGGFHVTDIAVSEPTLETVFISLTGKDLRE